MIEFNQEEQSEFSVTSEFGVKVIGIGGAGANVLDRMALEGSDDAELLTLNTDVRALSTSVSSHKIQLGSTLLKGMGTGGDPALGKQAAIEAVDEIRAAVRGCRMVFICVGLGGGTGSGAAPEVCRVAREEGVFLVVFATMPFTFEGERRMGQARGALESISRYANAVITFDNDRMGELIVPKDGVASAFAAADKIISQSIRATMNVVFRPGIIRIGMDDLLSAIDSDDSRCLFGYGVAKGDNRSHEALEQALKCPLLDRGKLLNEARSVLVQVAGGETMTLFEVQLVMEEISKNVGSETQILFGTGTDKRLGNSLTVTIISSISGPGAAQREEREREAAEAPAISLGMPLGMKPAYSEPEPGPLMEEHSSEEEESAFFAEEPEPEEESAVFEALEEAAPDEIGEVPAYAPDPLPPLFRPSREEGDDDSGYVGPKEEGVNPIARAMGAVPPALPPQLAVSEEEEPDASLGHVEALTDGSQKITLTRVVGSSNTGRIKTRDPLAPPLDGPVLPPSKPPTLPHEPLSEEARQQQEMLQLEPVSEGRGRFSKTDPTIIDGEDLDVPTFLRRKK